jgi:hypothetical protein
METPSVALTGDGNTRHQWAMRDSNPRHPACKAVHVVISSREKLQELSALCALPEACATVCDRP